MGEALTSFVEGSVEKPDCKLSPYMSFVVRFDYLEMIVSFGRGYRLQVVHAV